MTVWVAKPSYECAAGRVPYTIVVLLHAIVTLKYHSCSTQLLHRLANIRNCPSDCGVWSGLNVINLLNAQHRMANLKHQGRWLIRYKIQAEHALIKVS